MYVFTCVHVPVYVMCPVHVCRAVILVLCVNVYACVLQDELKAYEGPVNPADFKSLSISHFLVTIT